MEELQKAGIDEIIWPELRQQGASLLSLQSDLQYIKQVLAPFIGSQYIPPQELINLNNNEVQIYGAPQGVVMPDVTLLPLPSPPSPPPPSSSPKQQHLPCTICIEIKPKYGSITKCNTIHPEEKELKHSTSRYQLHQLLKRDQGTISTVSSYDPLDLFSGKTDRMEKALCSLLENPQNNLNIFINGKPVDFVDTSGEGVGITSDQCERCSLDKAISAAAAALLEPLNNQSDTTDGTNERNSLATLLRLILQQEPVLQNISRAQQACHVDIVGIYHLHHLMMLKLNAREERAEETCEEAPLDGSPIISDIVEDGDNDFRCRDDVQVYLTAREHRDAIDDVVRLPWKESVETLRSYVIATTAKDCSIMITMRSNGRRDARNKSKEKEDSSFLAKLQTEEENGNVVFFEKEEKEGLYNVEYRISVVDLDRKSTSKIPKHYELDQQIIKAAKKQREIQN
ncbi:hypothetical protein Ndes2526B_g07265 [Nannochloris sp. 'desiccata']|nr:hypothetical protein KSW81_004711 [Chlorella desiccata (nom. nud.)]KAH7618330.1 putative Inositol-pentakisphosphate 2-kinase [Chlorella desiccata (nom. nud.)]